MLGYLLIIAGAIVVTYILSTGATALNSDTGKTISGLLFIIELIAAAALFIVWGVTLL